MALEALHDALNGDGTFWKKVAGACWVAAWQIIGEDPETANHANRLVWAQQVQANRKAMARDMLAKVLENPTLAADPEGATDGDVQYVINSLVDTFATGG